MQPHWKTICLALVGLMLFFGVVCFLKPFDCMYLQNKINLYKTETKENSNCIYIFDKEKKNELQPGILTLKEEESKTELAVTSTLQKQKETCTKHEEGNFFQEDSKVIKAIDTLINISPRFRREEFLKKRDDAKYWEEDWDGYPVDPYISVIFESKTHIVLEEYYLKDDCIVGGKLGVLTRDIDRTQKYLKNIVKLLQTDSICTEAFVRKNKAEASDFIINWKREEQYLSVVISSMKNHFGGKDRAIELRRSDIAPIRHSIGYTQGMESVDSIKEVLAEFEININ